MSNPLLNKEDLDALWDKYEEEDPLQEGNEWGERCIKAEAKKLVEWIEEYGFAVSDNKGKPIGFNLPWGKWQELKGVVLDA